MLNSILADAFAAAMPNPAIDASLELSFESIDAILQDDEVVVSQEEEQALYAQFQTAEQMVVGLTNLEATLGNIEEPNEGSIKLAVAMFDQVMAPVGLSMEAMPATAGDNKYAAQPEKQSTMGKIKDTITKAVAAAKSLLAKFLAAVEGFFVKRFSAAARLKQACDAVAVAATKAASGGKTQAKSIKVPGEALAACTATGFDLAAAKKDAAALAEAGTAGAAKCRKLIGSYLESGKGGMDAARELVTALGITKDGYVGGCQMKLTVASNGSDKSIASAPTLSLSCTRPKVETAAPLSAGEVGSLMKELSGRCNELFNARVSMIGKEAMKTTVDGAIEKLSKKENDEGAATSISRMPGWSKFWADCASVPREAEMAVLRGMIAFASASVKAYGGSDAKAPDAAKPAEGEKPAEGDKAPADGEKK